MYTKIKEVQNILPNENACILFDKILVIQTGPNPNSLNNCSLKVISLNSLNIQEIKIESRFSFGVKVNDNSMIFFKADEEMEAFEIKKGNLSPKPILKGIRLNPFRNRENYFVWQTQKSANQKGGVYYYPENRILHTKKNFFPFGFINNFLFDLSFGKSTKIIHLCAQNGEVKWEMNLDNFIISLDERQKKKIYLIGVRYNELIVQIDSILILFLSMSSGEVLNFIDFRKEPTPKYLGEFFRNLALVGDKLCLLQSFYYLEIDLNEKKISCLKSLMLGLTRNELKKSYFFSGTSFNKNEILFVAKKDSNISSYIGVFSIQNRGIKWSINTEKEIISAPIANENYLYFIDVDYFTLLKMNITALRCFAARAEEGA